MDVSELTAKEKLAAEALLLLRGQNVDIATVVHQSENGNGNDHDTAVNHNNAVVFEHVDGHNAAPIGQANNTVASPNHNNAAVVEHASGHNAAAFIAQANGTVPAAIEQANDNWLAGILRIANLDGRIGRWMGPFTKVLRKSDVNPSQCRLIINKEHMRNQVFPLLTTEEKRILSLGGRTYECVEVEVYGVTGIPYDMKLKFWASKVHVLIENWKTFCMDHRLEENMRVTVWPFRTRYTMKLCFIIKSLNS